MAGWSGSADAAVFKLIVEFDRVGCSTGMSAGLVPFNDLIDLRGGLPGHCQTIGVEAHQSSGHNCGPKGVARREVGCAREIGDLLDDQ